MELRNLQSIGGGSSTIVIPKKWVTAWKLNAKDQLVMSMTQNNQLLIFPYKHLKRKSYYKLDISSLNTEEIFRFLLALYTLGYDSVELHGREIDPSVRKATNQVVNKVIGMEATQKTSGVMVVNNLLDMRKIMIMQYLEKAFIMSDMMLKDSIRAWVENNTLLAEDVIERDDEVDKIDFLICRFHNSLIYNLTLEEGLEASLAEAGFAEKVSKQIERFADHATKIAHIALLGKPKITEEQKKIVLDTGEDVSKLFETLKKTYNTKNLTAFNNLLSSSVKLADKIEKQNEKLFNQPNPQAIIVYASLARMTSYINNIAEAAIANALARMRSNEF